MRLLVGLGNPGPKYEANRHNIGFMAADLLVRRYDFGPWRARFQAQVAEGALGGESVLIMKPTTFMNESGRAVGEAVRFFKLAPEDVLVVYDELDLALGRLRVKQDGGHGGHNGLKSLDAHIGKAYWRLRLGIGHPGDKERVIGHVLGDFSKAECKTLDPLLEAVVHHMPLLVAGNAPDFMSKTAQDIAPSRPEKPEKTSGAAATTTPAKGKSAAQRLLEAQTKSAPPGAGQANADATDETPADGGLAGALKNLFKKD